jgi:hypothetical protein
MEHYDIPTIIYGIELTFFIKGLDSSKWLEKIVPVLQKYKEDKIPNLNDIPRFLFYVNNDPLVVIKNLKCKNITIPDKIYVFQAIHCGEG